MDKIEIIANIFSIITMGLLMSLMLYPIWGIFLTLKIIQISTLPPMIWWMIHTLLTILWVGTMQLLYELLKQMLNNYDYM